MSSTPTEAGSELVLDVGAPAAGGGFVARADDGRVVFVRHALPGERVRARVTSATSSFLRADAVEVLEASPDRVEPPCPYARPGRCGGCDWQHVALPRQRQLKAQLVAEQLRRLAGIDLEPVVEQVPGAPDGLGWRTRVQLAVDRAGRPGLHRHRSRELELVDRCLIAAPEVEAVGAERLRWPGAEAVEVTGADGQRVVAVASRHRARPRLPELDEHVGLTVDGRPLRVPHGVVHTVLGRRFEVAAGGFWQVHVGAAEVLAKAVLDGLDPRPGERAVDLFSGAGLFAALIGERVGERGAVVAVEADRRACTDAARNTADLPQVRTVMAPVTPELVRGLDPPDLVVLDPPRAGAGLAVTAALTGLRPRRLAYLACDPASFARDLRVLLDAGWTLTALRALDLFPMTEHVELVALLEPPSSP
ncbi:MAG TPA: TRAM domain-containing protein [Mycobacteriales bacterium]|nr:TRAM domain-containing protein [Mycobacteriales bacterium]